MTAKTHSLSEGALDQIMKGVQVEQPIIQMLGHKKVGSSGQGERYRLLISDGKRINSFTMLATQLNTMITQDVLTEFSICQINRYAISMVNNAGKQRRVMVILNIDVKVSGSEVGHKIGNPSNVDPSEDGDINSKSVAPSPPKKYNVTSMAKPIKQSTEDITSTPIAALSPYLNRWVIKVRVMSKSAIRTWSNSRGEGKLFNMDLIDESGEIRCTAFRDQCDKFYDMIEAGSVYYISRCSLKTANKQFNNLKNDYEMTMTNDTEIIPCHDAGDEIPNIQYEFVPISELANKEKNDLIDILGIIKSTGILQAITSRTTGREMVKRDIDIVDESNSLVTLTLWGDEATAFDTDNTKVNNEKAVAIKGARVGEFNGGKNLSTISSSVMQIEPDIPEAHRLLGWYNSVGRNQETKSLSKAFGSGGGGSGPWMTFKETLENELGKEGSDVYTVKATINMIRVENSLYKSCPTDACKKKLVDQANEMYRCEKCDREYPNFKYRLLASLNLVDSTESVWVTAFNEEAEKILGASADELGELQQSDNEAYLEKFAEATFQTFVFKIRVQSRVFSDEKKLSSSCVAVDAIDYKEDNNRLLMRIKELAGIEKA